VQTLTVILPTRISHTHDEWLSEFTDLFIGIKMNRHQQNIDSGVSRAGSGVCYGGLQMGRKHEACQPRPEAQA
jgi:hypothetical protein